jgi:tetratricopeptide (TPR) repeat protein
LGRKQTRAWKYICLYVASLTFLILFVLGCATLIGSDFRDTEMLLARGDYEDALEKNMKVLARFSNIPPADKALFNLGLIYAHYGNPNKDYKKAFSFFWRLSKDFPQSPLAEEAKIWVGVLNTIEETKIKLEGQRSVHQYLLRNQTLLAKGDYEDALEKNMKVLARNFNRPPGDEALFNMGLIYAHLKDYKKALESFGRLLKDFPQSSLSEEAKIWTEVLNTIEETKIKLEGQRSVHQYLLRNQTLLAKGDYKDALEKNIKVLARNPDRPPGDEALFNMGLIYAHLKDYKKALESFERLLKDFPQSSLSEEAKIWTGVLNAIEETKKVDIEIEEIKKELVK